MNYPIQKTEAQWQEALQAKNAEPGALAVTRHAATERPFTGKFEAHWQDGSYHCICCGNKLFDSGTKFDAGCGWPSFSQAVPGAIAEITDSSHGMIHGMTTCNRMQKPATTASMKLSASDAVTAAASSPSRALTPP